MVAVIWRIKTYRMTELITPFEDLLNEAQIIQETLEAPIPSDIESVVMLGHELIAYIARTGKMRSDAKYYLNKAVKSSIMAQVKELGKTIMPASTLNELVKASCENESYLFDWCDRLNRTATHQVDWLRSVVSKEKEQMRLSGGFNNR